MIKVPEIILGEMMEMIEMRMVNLNGKIKKIRSLEQTNGDLMMSQDRRAMSGDRTRHQTNGEQIMNWATSNHPHQLILR